MKHPSPAQRLLRASLAVAALLTAPTLLRAQQAQNPDAGPIIIGQREKVPAFQFDKPEATANFTARYTENSIEPQDGTKDESTETVFEESLTLSTHGHIIHPNLVEMNLSGTVGLTQTTIDQTDGSESRNGYIYSYDASATILRNSDAPLTLYGQRSIGYVSQPFASTLESVTNTYGALWNIKSRQIPTSFRLYHTDENQTSLSTAEDDFSYSQNGFEAHSEARPTSSQLLTFDYSYQSVDQSSLSITNGQFDAHNATVTHNLELDKDRRSSLNSSLNYFSQTGDFDQERLRLSEQLNLHHTKSFETFYNYEYNQSTYGAVEQTLNRATGGFRHQLYESLNTTGTLGYQALDQGSAGTQELFANLGTEYTKKVPLGLLTASIQGGISRQHNDERTDNTVVVDESHTLSTTSPIIITNRALIPSSIHITDSRGLVQYTKGIHYLVFEYPDRTEILRNPSAPIAENTPILLDYELAPEPANQTDTNTLAFGLRYDFERGPLEGLGVFGRYFIQDQVIDASSYSPDLIADDVRALTLGADYRVWKLLFAAEHEWHDSTRLPYNANRYRAQYQDRWGYDTTFALTLSRTEIDYTDEDNLSVSDTVSATLEQRLSQRLRATLSVTYFDQADNILQDSRGLEEQLELKWSYRQTDVYGLIRNSNLETDGDKSNFLFVQVGIQRKL